MGKTEDIHTGMAMSREIIEDGEALAKISRWVKIQADAAAEGLRKYLDVAAQAGIRTEAVALL